MKIIKFLFFAVGVFVELIIFLWIVIHLWWLILAVIALFIAYGFMHEEKEEAKSDQPEEKPATSNDPFEND